MDTIDFNGAGSIIQQINLISMNSSSSQLNMNNAQIINCDLLDMNSSGSQIQQLDSIIMLDDGSRINMSTGQILNVEEISGEVGQAHKINWGGTAITITSELIGDDVRFQTGSSRSNVTVQVEDIKTTFFTDNTETAAYDIQIVQNNNTPFNTRTIGNIRFIAENSASVDITYALISATSNDVNSSTPDGLLQFGVVSAGATIRVGFEMAGFANNANGVILAFYGESMVAQQVLAASPSAAQISTVLEALGLTKFS